MPWRTERAQSRLVDAISNIHEAVREISIAKYETLEDMQQASTISDELVGMAKGLQYILQTGLRTGQVTRAPRL